MASNYFFMQEGQECGPISAARLKKLTDSGRLGANDLVRKEGTTKWAAAQTFPGLCGKTAADKYCSECGKLIRVKAEICPHCGVRQQLSSSSDPSSLKSWIKVTLLISAIWNALLGMSLLATLVLFFLAPFPLVLCIDEFIAFSKVDSLSSAALSSRVRAVAFWEICMGFLCNFPTMICGIVNMINAGNLEPKMPRS